MKSISLDFRKNACERDKSRYKSFAFATLTLTVHLISLHSATYLKPLIKKMRNLSETSPIILSLKPLLSNLDIILKFEER